MSFQWVRSSVIIYGAEQPPDRFVQMLHSYHVVMLLDGDQTHVLAGINDIYV